MAGEDYSVKTKVEADVSNFEKGMNKAEKSLKGFSNKLADNINRLGKKGLIGSIANVTLAVGGLTQSFNTVIKFAKNVSKAINECTEAYKGQVIAERALNTAIENNPFITGESSKALLQFATDMQKVTNYGDEELIPMMTNLVSLGRTESEVMQIMSVAMDMSAGMGISLDSAITQLNATLNGNIGRLGQQNAELKGLTEEELKQGKAVDILGKKFKGFASATADTSKQLKNIKGDFKEVIGQFTLPSSDMWNRFWAGFYQSGIDVINRFNDYLDTQIIGKKILDNLKSNAKLVANATGNTVEEVLSDFRYLKDQISYLSDSELSTLQKTLEKQKDRSEAEERMLTIVKEITNSRKLNLDYERELAEKEAKTAQALTEQEEIENGIAELKAKHLAKIKEQEEKWKNTERVMGKAVSLEEKLKFYQDDLVAIMTEAGGQITTNNEYYKKQSAIINEILSQLGETVVETEWQKKLFDQKIEMLEAERDRAMEIAEQEGKESYTIWRDYNEKILELKLQRLEEEKEKALKEEGLTADDKISIEEYYKNEIERIYTELGEYKKKKNGEEVKDEESKFKKMLALMKRFANSAKTVISQIAEKLKKVFSTMQNVFSKLGNIFKKVLDIFNFNPDEALTSLLKVEDSILTFFVETLPKLPAFFASAIKSVIVLLDKLVKNVDWEKIQEIINSIIDTIVENAPTIIENLLTVVINIAQALLNGIIHFVETGGWKMLLDMFLMIQKRIEKFVTDNIDAIVQTIIDMLPDLIQTLIDSIVSASQTLAKLIKPILKLIIALIKALVEVAFSDEVLDASMEVIQAFIEAIVDILIKDLPRTLPKLIIKIVTFILKSLPKMATTLIKAFVKILTETNWGEVLYELFMAIVESFAELGKMIGEVFYEIVMSISEIFSGLGQILNNLWKWIVDGATNFFQGFFDWLNNGWKWLVEGVDWVVKQIQQGFEWAFGGIKNFFDGVFQGITWGIQQIQQAFQWLKGGWDWFWGGPKSWFGWANGTNDAPKGLALVGEQGPELVKFNGGEQVLNTRNTQKLLSDAGKGSGNTFNVTFNNLQDTTAYAMMQQLKQYNRQMAINSII